MVGHPEGQDSGIVYAAMDFDKECVGELESGPRFAQVREIVTVGPQRLRVP